MLTDLIDTDILSVAVLRRYYDMAMEEEYLKQHIYKIYQGKDGRWYTYIPDHEKKTKRRQVVRKTRKELNAAIVKAYKSLEDNPTVTEVFKEWQNRRLYLDKVCDATITRERQIYNRHFSEFGKHKIKNLTPDEWIEFLEDEICRCKLSRKAFSNLKGIVRGMLKRAKKRKLILYSVDTMLSDLDVTESDFKKAFIEDDKEIFYDDEFKKIMSYCYDHRGDLRSLGVALMFVSGLRVGEVVTLKFEDIFADTIYVHRTETRYNKEGHNYFEVKEYPKTPAGIRKVIIPENYLWVLESLKEKGQRNEFIFTLNGSRFHTETIRRKQTRICIKLNITPKSPHKARKTYASILLDNNVDRKIIEKQMGHTDISCTENHYHRDRRREDQKRKVLNSIPEFIQVIQKEGA